jgi:aspartyl-tRNA(Asn)/glutamyl-tRNA(Gln) amidotransferase subunit B
VSEPDIRTGAEAVAYAQEMRRIVRYLGVCDGNMQEGSLRCDLNVSVRPVGTEKFGTKVEIKNMNSFNALQRATDYEIARQIEAIEAGEAIRQETRLWEENSQRTISMRSKEGSSDYRYFPEPDLVPIEITAAQLTQFRSELPELPISRRARYESYGLTPYDAALIADDSGVSDFYDAAVTQGADPKQSFNWIMGDVTAYLNETKQKISEIPFTPVTLTEMLDLIAKGTISTKIAKDILPELLVNGGSVQEVVTSKGLTVLAGDALSAIIDEVIANNPKEVEQYRAGKTKLLGFFVGQVMKKTQGRAEPQTTNELILAKLQG